MKDHINLEKAHQIFKNNFIGIQQLKSLFNFLELEVDSIVSPDLDYNEEYLRKMADEGYILILGIPNVDTTKLNILTLRDRMGINPEFSEPCFYNQDWYLSEDFIKETLEFKWYFIKKDVIESSRGKQPIDLLDKGMHFPSAILATYTFFAYYFANKEYLWWHDFIWCSDLDHNGDRIYVGKYNDIDGVNKNGFSIHRHLALRPCYAAVEAD